MNNYKRIAIVTGIVVCVLVQLEGLGFGDGPEVLRGLERIEVVVEQLDPEVEKDGLIETQLKTDVELKLRLAGIKVISFEEFQKTPASAASLILNISIIKTSRSWYAFYAELNLMESAITLRHFQTLKYFGMVSWESKGFIGYTPDLSTVRNVAKDLVDEFVTAYLAVNPKK